MIDELQAAIKEYQTKWQGLMSGRKDRAFFESLRPTAAGWKTTDLADFEQRYTALRDISDQIHLGWVNERWLATFHLKDDALPWGLTTVKLMQRRPGSTDAVGLDHMDFLLEKDTDVKAVLQAEPNLKWNEEKNGDHCKWLSVWFNGSEAKLRADTVWDVCVAEMKEVRATIAK
ncbi:MAG TPA: hypothetical protein VMY99_02965 [Nevskiaceae bacterium]|nr:hypothetical protein [Nevskiaceae bacterium]